MEDQLGGVLDWAYFYQAKSAEDLTESLLLTTMELEATRLRAQEELRARDDQLTQLKTLLGKAVSERDEAQNRYQALLLQYHPHRRHNHHQPTPAPPHSAISSVEDEIVTNGGFSSSDCEESIVSSPPVLQSSEKELTEIVPTKGLPEKGKLLEAVMKAGPLLQNLLLAGPLPHWRHPPPPLDTYQIPPPPVVVPTGPPPTRHGFDKFNKKRGFLEGSDSSRETKYQRIALHYS